MGIRKGLFVTTLLAIVPLARGAMPLDPADSGATSTFSITHQTQVPGEVLKPGDYSIQIVEHISDRMIVRIDGAQGKEHILFLGVPNLDASAYNNGPGLQTWHSGSDSLPTLRGFNFPTGTAVDFVYPKAEAAALAKANAATVIAIDPESEGRPAKLKNLTSDDMREINLWMLTLTSTGPSDNKVAALEAKRYQPRSASTTQLADTSPVPSRPAPVHETRTNNSLPQTQIAKLDQPALPHSVHSNRKPVASELPHTASLLPAVMLLGCVSFFASAALFVRRKLLRPSL